MFHELCGDKFARNIVFLTTMWDKVRDVKAAEQKEASLKERYWNVMINHGATVERFHVNGSGFKSPWLIVDKMIKRYQPGQALLLQEEMVDIGKRLEQTNVGKALSSNLRRLLIKQNRVELLEETNRGRTDADIEKEMDAFCLEIESMKTPLARRLALFYGKALGRKSG
jgi:hypothetical protein